VDYVYASAGISPDVPMETPLRDMKLLANFETEDMRLMVEKYYRDHPPPSTSGAGSGRGAEPPARGASPREAPGLAMSHGILSIIETNQLGQNK